MEEELNSLSEFCTTEKEMLIMVTVQSILLIPLTKYLANSIDSQLVGLGTQGLVVESFFR